MAKKTDKTATYPVLGRLRYDGQLYDVGDTVDAAESDAATLIAAGVLGQAQAPASAPAAKDPPKK